MRKLLGHFIFFADCNTLSKGSGEKDSEGRYQTSQDILTNIIILGRFKFKNNKGSLPNHKNANKMFVRIFMKVLFNKF